MDTPETCTTSKRKFGYPADYRMAYAGFRMLYLEDEMLETYRNAIEGSNKAETGTVDWQRRENSLAKGRY